MDPSQRGWPKAGSNTPTFELAGNREKSPCCTEVSGMTIPSLSVFAICNELRKGVLWSLKVLNDQNTFSKEIENLDLIGKDIWIALDSLLLFPEYKTDQQLGFCTKDRTTRSLGGTGFTGTSSLKHLYYQMLLEWGQGTLCRSLQGIYPKLSKKGFRK